MPATPAAAATPIPLPLCVDLNTDEHVATLVPLLLLPWQPELLLYLSSARADQHVPCCHAWLDRDPRSSSLLPHQARCCHRSLELHPTDSANATDTLVVAASCRANAVVAAIMLAAPASPLLPPTATASLTARPVAVSCGPCCRPHRYLGLSQWIPLIRYLARRELIAWRHPRFIPASPIVFMAIVSLHR
ncbi:hypothetical protein NL676_030542 [Syzygium grande]|nr:hypothetical protein NL676_030542 [Syzygium grande]